MLLQTRFYLLLEAYFNINFLGFSMSLKKTLSRFYSVTLVTVAMIFNGSILANEFISTAIVIKNVDVFDGVNPSLLKNTNVLIIGDQIESININLADIPSGAKVMDGSGHTLIPGLIDAHWHTFMASVNPRELFEADDGYLHTRAAVEATNTLMRGFTTVRDVAGPVFGLKKAIDEGYLKGPRIYPSGAGISQTSGHGDLRLRFNQPQNFGGTPSRWEQLGLMQVADGKANVLTAVREQLRLGASQIKIMGGGGVGSVADPLESIQFTTDEIKSAVQAAEDFGTYVTAHIYTSKATVRAINAGVKSIEHGHLLDKETLELMVKKGVWLSIQPFEFEHFPDSYTESQKEKGKIVNAGTQTVYKLAKKLNVNMAFGTDLLFSAEEASKQNEKLVSLEKWFTPFEVLTMATGNNGQFMRLTGNKNPYPKKLGVIEKGAYADLLLIKGNPLENLGLLIDYQNNISLIIKNGKVVKNNINTKATGRG